MNWREIELLHQTSIIYGTDLSILEFVWQYIERIDQVLRNNPKIKRSANRY